MLQPSLSTERSKQFKVKRLFYLSETLSYRTELTEQAAKAKQEASTNIQSQGKGKQNRPNTIPSCVQSMQLTMVYGIATLKRYNKQVIKRTAQHRGYKKNLPLQLIVGIV